MLFFNRKKDTSPVAFTEIIEKRRALHLVLPADPTEALYTLGAVRQWPGLFSSMQIAGDGWDLPLLRCARMEGSPTWNAIRRELQWADGSLVIDLNPKRPKHLPSYPRRAAVVRMGEGSNLDLAPPPKKPGQLLHELARLTGLPFEMKMAEVDMPQSALDAARRQLRPEMKHHVLIHANRTMNKKILLAAARVVKQMLSCAVYLSGTPSWKHDIPDLHFVKPSSLLELLALAQVCDAAAFGDARLGSLPDKLLKNTVGLSRYTASELAAESGRARLQADLKAAMKR